MNLEPLVLPLLPGRAVGPFFLGTPLVDVMDYLASAHIESIVMVDSMQGIPPIVVNLPSLGLVLIFHPYTQVSQLT